MNSKILTPLILSSALTLGAFSFVACGEDSTSVKPTPGVSSSSTFVPLSYDVGVETAIVFSGLGIGGIGAKKINFKGDISIDLGNEATVEDIEAVHFTEAKFEIVNKDQVKIGEAETTTPIDFSKSTLNLQELGLFTDIDAPMYTECGEFTLYITVKVDDGYIENVGQDLIRFTRPEEKCYVPESSSSEAKVPGAPLDSHSVSITTSYQKSLNLTTLTASADATGDMCFKTIGTNGKIQLTSTTGLKFAVYNNENDGDRRTNYSKQWLPQNPTTDSFTYLEGALKDTIPDLLGVGDRFLVAIAPNHVRNSGSAVGYYALIVTDNTTPNTNGDLTFTLLVYKGK